VKEPELLGAANRLCDRLVSYFTLLNCAFSKLRMFHGTPKEEDYIELEEAVQKLADPAQELDLNYIPSVHYLIDHGPGEF